MENNVKRANENGSARNEILAAIRSNLAASMPFDALRENDNFQASETIAEPVISPSRAVLLENFRLNLEAVGGHCVMVSNETEAAKAVDSVIEHTDSSKIAISDSEIVRRLTAETEVIENASARDLFDCDIGVTSAQWAVAETGTLVLESEKESHRLTSLVPPVHVCILQASNIRQTLREILELTSRDLSRTMTFITGASRTSDIELTLAIGVHGPRDLHVIVLEN